MVNITEAYEIAKEKAMGFQLLETYETEDMWIFNFGVVNENGMKFPGAPNVAIDKRTKEISYITVPPIENLKILKAAKKMGTDWLLKENN